MKKILGLFVVVIALSGFISAQNENAATVTGQVVDSAGAAVPNATIVVTNTSTGITRQAQTNDQGNYSVYPLIPGEYTVSVEQAGFKKTVVNVTLNAKDRRPVDIVLEVGEASEVVTITSEPPLIQESPTGQTLVSGNQVTELPLNNRNFIRLLETVPGVSSDLVEDEPFSLSSLASVSINGMRRNAVNYLVDGVSNTDVGSNITLLSTPTVDSIQEFKVLSSNYTAEVGRSGGGSVVIVTRGGGNNFHGSLYEFVRNDYFNANTFFNNRRGRNADGTPVADVPRLRYNNFGGTISGPVFIPNFGNGGPQWLYNGRDKTFFFFSEEVRRISRASTTASATVPTVAQRQGDFSAQLGAPVCRTPAGAFTTNCAAPNTPVMAVDTAGNTIQIQSGQIFRQSDNAPYAGNIIPAGNLDPRALGLLQAYPLPNLGTNGFISTQTAINNTRQEVFRIDHNFTSNHKIFGRYTQDLSENQEPGGLFTGIALPNVATTSTKIPGKVLAIVWTGIFSSNVVNELSYNFSSNDIASQLIGRGRRSDYAGAEQIVEFFPENNNNAIPTIGGTGFSTIGALQGYSIEYANSGFRDVLTWTKSNHIIKFGGEWTWEIKNENAGNVSQGNFGFSTLQTRGFVGADPITGTGVTTGNAFSSFLLGRANTYSESETDFRVNFRFGRREFFAQDTWKVRPNLTLDYGVRYQYYQPPYDKNDRIGSFDTALYDRSQTICANAGCTSLTTASNRNNGFGIANSTSRFGRSIVPNDFNNFSPRVGFAWDPFKDGKTIVRAGYGFYYDQALIGVFEQAAFTTPAFSPNASFTSTPTSIITFDNPGAGAPPGTLPLVSTIAMASDFKTPETQQWSVGIQREIFKNAVADISYVGTKGDNLLRRRNINFLTPSQVVAVGTGFVNANAPFVGLTSITYIETSARSRYHGLLSSLNYRLPKGFTITLAYTFSKNLTDATNDRDAIDDPQNPFNLQSEYAEARTSRPHVFSASYVYEIPFFRKSENTAVRLFLGGWQVSGITNIESGPPLTRVTNQDTQSGQRGLYANITGDPTGGLSGTTDPETGLPFLFDPTVFERTPLGQFGSAPRAFARAPGRNYTNLALTKQFYFNSERTIYLQVRAESFNLFNHTQFTVSSASSHVLPTNGPLSNTTFARPTGTRLPREFQFGAKLYF